MNPETFVMQLEQLEAQTALLLASIRTVKQVFLDAVPKPEEPEPEEGPDGACYHPAQYRIPAPASGKMNRFVCKRCRQTVE